MLALRMHRLSSLDNRSAKLVKRRFLPWQDQQTKYQGIAPRNAGGLSDFVMKKTTRTVALVVLGVEVIASIASRPRTSDLAKAPLLAGAQVPPPVRSILERSCQDCHSEATRYPWYSYVAPISFLINSDVESGRRHLNFSKWSEYSVIQRERRLSEIANQVQDGKMPISIYLLMHRDAKLSQGDIDTLFNWTQEEKSRLIMENLPVQSR